MLRWSLNPASAPLLDDLLIRGVLSFLDHNDDILTRLKNTCKAFNKDRDLYEFSANANMNLHNTVTHHREVMDWDHFRPHDDDHSDDYEYTDTETKWKYGREHGIKKVEYGKGKNTRVSSDMVNGLLHGKHITTIHDNDGYVYGNVHLDTYVRGIQHGLSIDKIDNHSLQILEVNNREGGNDAVSIYRTEVVVQGYRDGPITARKLAHDGDLIKVTQGYDEPWEQHYSIKYNTMPVAFIVHPHETNPISDTGEYLKDPYTRKRKRLCFNEYKGMPLTEFITPFAIDVLKRSNYDDLIVFDNKSDEE